MEAATRFAVAGETMDFTLRHILEGHSTPPALFVEIIVEKCHLINYHFERTKNHLRVVANANATTATIALHDINIEDSTIKVVTMMNTSDLEQQLVHLWREVHQVLKFYHEDNRIAELANINKYYNTFAYNRMIVQCFIRKLS